MRRLTAAFILALALLGGCFLFHDDYPDRKCETNSDCFQAQGEVCNTQTKTCVSTVDAGVSNAQ